MPARKLKVMLVTPPYHAGVVESAGVWMNVAFVYLAGSLRAAGHEPIVYDAMSYWHDEARVREEIARVRPDVIASTAVTASFPAAVRVMEMAKALNPSVVTVLGNVHPTFMWRDVLTEHPAVDFVVRGEGEITIAELANALADGMPVSEYGTIKGLAFRDEDGDPSSGPARPMVEDLDSLPTAWDLIDWPTYTYRPRPGSTLAVVSSSRGCMQKCSFCSQMLFWHRSWRPRSPESFVSELEMLRDRYGVSVAMLSDETPTTDRARWERILDLLIEREVGVELLMETRVDDILRDEDILDRYGMAGISHIYIGVEATRQDNLDAWHKDISVEQSKRAIELINSHDIVSETSFVLGMPDETPETIAQTIELAKHYAPDLAFFLAITPWPYANIWHDLKDHLAVHDYSRFNLVEAVVKPEAMTVAEMTGHLGRASHMFYADKLERLAELSPFKRSFMVKVMKILMEHSYLANDMKGLQGEMPPHVKRMIAALEAEHAREAAEADPKGQRATG